MYRLQLDFRFAVARAKSVFTQSRDEPVGVEDGCRLIPCEMAGSSFLRTCGWGGVAKFIGDVVCKGNEPGAIASHAARVPGGRIPSEREATGGRAQSNPRSPAAPNADRGCSGTNE